jgi:dTDP-4-dehydrorhamnose reductase
MRLLVTGAGGLFGSNVAAVAERSGETVTATYHNRRPDVPVSCAQLDITDAERFETLLTDHAPDTVVNCAAMTDVDRCERKPERARRINGDAPGTLAGIAADRDVAFMQVSTDYVFDGRSGREYEPDDETRPIQTYGRTELLGERRVRSGHPNPLVVRLSFVYGRNDRGDIGGFPGWLLERLRNEESTPLFTDQHVTPRIYWGISGT